MHLLKRFRLQLIIIIAGAAVYGQCIFFDFQHWDDMYYLVNNPNLKAFSWSTIRALFTPGSLPLENLYIPLSYLSFLPNGAFFGFNPSLAHGVNVLLHIINSLLVFHLFKILFRPLSLNTQHSTVDTQHSIHIPLLATLFFMFHPIQVESVAWAMSRRELLGALFTMSSALVYQAFVSKNHKSCYGASVGLFAISILCKPNMMLVPLVFPAFYLITPPDSATDATQPPGLTKTWFTRVATLIPFILIMLGTYFLNSNPGGDKPELLATLGYLPYIAHEWILRIFYVSQPHPFYLWSTLSPGLVSVKYLIIPFCCLAFLIALVRLKAYRPCFMALIFLVALAPAGHIILLKSRIFYTADRYGYLAMAGIAGLLAWLFGKIPYAQRRLSVSITIIGLIWGAICFMEVRSWKTPQTMGEYALQHNPDNAIALTILGTCSLKKNEPSLAKAYYMKAIDRDIMKDGAWQNLFVIAQRTGDSQKDQIHRHWQIAKFGWTYTTYLAAKRLKDGGQTDQALTLIEQRMAHGNITKECADIYFLLGSLYQMKKEWQKAVAAYSLCLDVAPEKDAATFNMGVSALNSKGYQLAARTFVALLKKHGDGDHLVHYNLGIAYLNLNHHKHAAEQLAKCQHFKSDFNEVYDPLIQAYVLVDKPQDARAVFDLAISRKVALRPQTRELLNQTLPQPPVPSPITTP
ncbi:hypothetical protein BVX99_01620 [bacterium F16]|nr:hypothetical protein BVX99_01620 [bacterium F16]